MSPKSFAVEHEGKTYHVHPLNAGQYRRLVRYMRGKGADPVRGDFMLLAWSVRDEHGTPVYPTADDAETMTNDLCNTILPACVRVNGFEDDDEKKATSDPTPLA